MEAVALDFETTKEPRHLPFIPGSSLVLGSTFTDEGTSRTYVFDHKEVIGSQEEAINDLTKDITSDIILIAHNLQFELIWLYHLNIIPKSKFWCTMVAEYILSGQRIRNASLEELANMYGFEGKMLNLSLVDKETYEIPLETLQRYCEHDAWLAYHIYEKQVQRAQKLGVVNLIRIHSSMSLLFAMASYNGMKLDMDFLIKYGSDLENRILEIEKEVQKIVGYPVNIKSPKQLQAALYGGTFKVDGKEKVRRVLKSGKIKEYERKCKKEVTLPGIWHFPEPKATDRPTIKTLPASTPEQKRLKNLLMEYSQISMSWKTFAKGFQKKAIDGLIHPKYHQTVTVTGRPSSSDPNGQNIPRSGTAKIKRAFISRWPNGILLEIDLKGIEWRCAADRSNDPVMIQEIIDGVDPHAHAATHWFGDIKHRTDAKTFNFRYIYGGTPIGFYYDPRMPNFSLKKWQEIVRQLERKYHVLVEWNNRNIELVYERGYLRNPSGRILFFELKERNGVVDYKIPEIKNYPIQSWATADIAPLFFVRCVMKNASIIFLERLAYVIGFIHDSIMFDCKDEKVAYNIAKNAKEVIKEVPGIIKKIWNYELKVPLDIEAKFGFTWYDMKEMEV